MTDVQDRADEVRDRALEQIERSAEAESKMERMEMEVEATEEFAEEFAECLDEGLGSSKASPVAAVVSDAAKWHNKTDIQQKIQNNLEELEGQDKPPFDEIVRERLREVQVIRTTDHRQGSTYRWKFTDCEIETQGGGGKNRRGHFNWHNFRDLYLEASGEDASKPQQDLRGGEEWRSFIVEMIEDRGTETEFEGPRTTAVKQLKNHIRNSNGYGSREAMVEFDGIHVDIPEHDIPDWWGQGQPFAGNNDDTPDWVGETEIPTFEPHEGRSTPKEVVEEIYVPNHLINRVVKNNEISHQALQVELNARGHTPARLNGAVSESDWVNGNERTWWALKPSLAVPQVYIPTPKSAAEKAEEEGIGTSRNSEEEEDDTDELDMVGGD